MTRHALIDHRPWLLASLVGAVAFYFLRDNPLGGAWLILLKGSGVGLLAIYAMRRTRGLDGGILVLVMALGAAGDMALVLNTIAGGIFFLASHLVAVVLYLRHRRERTTFSQKLFAGVVAILTPAIAYLLSGDGLTAVYALVLGLMAAAAWTSRFPRYRVGLGAVLFIASDLLIFSEFGSFNLAPLTVWLIWPLYYAAQFMIATGVVQTLRRDHEA